MCIYSHFQYLCLHQKLKIIKACSKAYNDAHGVLTCPDAQVSDGTPLTFGHRTYGLGVCDSIQCAWDYAILPVGDYGNDIKFGNSTSFEDDTEIEDSPDACEERVGRWFRLLSADQQLDHFKTEYPIPEHELSHAGLAVRNFPCAPAVTTWLDTLRWQELNPLYLTPPMLQWCVATRILPASVVDGRKSKTITPRKPIFGPFQVKATHRCSTKYGVCKVCGLNIGSKHLKETTLSERQHTALAKLMFETPVGVDLRGTAWDPKVKLKWDDAKGEYHIVPTNSPVNIYVAPYPASSNPAFVPSTTQAVDTAAVFSGQDDHFADSSTYANAEHALTGGMDFDAFVESVALDGQTSATFGDNSWQNPNFFDTDNLSTMSQPGLGMNNDFSFGTGASLNAGIDTTSGAGNQFELPFRTTGSQFNTFTHAQPSELDNTTYQYSDNQTQLANQFSASQQTSQPLGFSMNQDEDHMFFSNPDSISQDIDFGFADDPMDTCDFGEGQ
jgi:hypothetical protein